MVYTGTDIYVVWNDSIKFFDSVCLSIHTWTLGLGTNRAWSFSEGKWRGSRSEGGGEWEKQGETKVGWDI